MLFSSTTFLFIFLPVVLCINFLIPYKFKNVSLLLASLFFYVWGETFYLTLMLLSIGVNYYAGLFIERYRGGKNSRFFLFTAVSLNLLFLGWFKYGNFFIDNLNVLIKFTGLPVIEIRSIHLPIGISFFTFQAMSYIIDVYRNKIPSQKKPVNIALYISLFPQLIAGPIVRYHDIAEQIIKRTVNFEALAIGIRLFIFGLGKKMIIANPMGEVADKIFTIPLDFLTTPLAWIGIICYTLQIYFDFSGYSDMAIGLGRMLGFKFPENFNYPYISQSIREFWKRWHISLSSWFKDYLYIPLGGNRGTRLRTYFNLWIVFLLCGLWHGASWNFIIWGMLHGTFLVFERLGLMQLINGLARPFRHMYALIVIMVGWVFFRAETLTDAIGFIKSMAGFAKGTGLEFNAAMFLNNEIIIIFALGIIFSMPFSKVLEKIINEVVSRAKGLKGLFKISFYGAELFMVLFIFFICLINLAAGTYNPFIYFRF